MPELDFNFDGIKKVESPEAESTEPKFNFSGIKRLEQPKNTTGKIADQIDVQKAKDLATNEIPGKQSDSDITFEQKPVRNLRDLISRKYERGQVIVDRGTIGATAMWGGISNEEALEQAAGLKIEGGKLTPPLKLDIKDPVGSAKSLGINMVAETAELLPFMWSGMKEGAKSGFTTAGIFATGAVVLGQAGPQAAVPEEAITVPTAAITGFKIGSAYGVFKNTAKIEGGNSYLDLIESGVDPETARPVAMMIGAVNGAIEIAQVGRIVKRLPGGQKLIGKGADKVLQSKSFRKLFLNMTKQFGKDIAAETGQEVLQEGVTLSGEAIAHSIDALKKNQKYQGPEAQEALDRLGEVLKMSALGFPLLAAPGNIYTGARGARNVIRSKAEQKEDSLDPITDEERKEAAEQFKNTPKMDENLAKKDLDEDIVDDQDIEDSIRQKKRQSRQNRVIQARKKKDEEQTETVDPEVKPIKIEVPQEILDANAEVEAKQAEAKQAEQQKPDQKAEEAVESEGQKKAEEAAQSFMLQAKEAGLDVGDPSDPFGKATDLGEELLEKHMTEMRQKFGAQLNEEGNFSLENDSVSQRIIKEALEGQGIDPDDTTVKPGFVQDQATGYTNPNPQRFRTPSGQAVTEIIKEGMLIKEPGSDMIYRVEGVTGPYNRTSTPERGGRDTIQAPQHYSLILSDVKAKRTKDGKLPKNYKMFGINDLIAVDGKVINMRKDGGPIDEVFEVDKEGKAIEREQPTEDYAETSDIKRIADAVYEHYNRTGGIKDKNELKRIASDATQKPAESLVNEMNEAIEEAFSRINQERISRMDETARRDVRQRVAEAEQTELDLPVAFRSLEKIDKQQFSTPFTLSEAAAYAADVRQGESVIEPTAGTGNLILPLDETGKRLDILANEIDPNRAEILRRFGFNTTEQDYLKMNRKADVVITNPPWGSLKTGKQSKFAADFNPTDISQRFIAHALKNLNDGGRLVAIMPPNVAKAASFLKWLQKEYYIAALFKSPPKAYDKRATNIESYLLVVDKVSDDWRTPTMALRTDVMAPQKGTADPETLRDYADMVNILADGGVLQRPPAKKLPPKADFVATEDLQKFVEQSGIDPVKARFDNSTKFTFSKGRTIEEFAAEEYNEALDAYRRGFEALEAKGFTMDEITLMNPPKAYAVKNKMITLTAAISRYVSEKAKKLDGKKDFKDIGQDFYREDIQGIDAAIEELNKSDEVGKSKATDESKKYTEEEAKAEIEKTGRIKLHSSSGKIGQKSNETGIKGFKKTTLDFLNSFVEENDLNATITAGTEEGHMKAEISHENGDKFDLRSEPDRAKTPEEKAQIEKLNETILAYGATETRKIGKRTDKGYKHPSGQAIFWKEPNHWDVEVIPSSEQAEKAQQSKEFKKQPQAQEAQKSEIMKAFEKWNGGRTDKEWSQLGQIFTSRLKTAKTELNRLAQNDNGFSVADKVEMSKARTFGEIKDIIERVEEKQRAEEIKAQEKAKEIPVNDRGVSIADIDIQVFKTDPNNPLDRLFNYKAIAISQKKGYKATDGVGDTRADAIYSAYMTQGFTAEQVKDFIDKSYETRKLVLGVEKNVQDTSSTRSGTRGSDTEPTSGTTDGTETERDGSGTGRTDAEPRDGDAESLRPESNSGASNEVAKNVGVRNTTRRTEGREPDRAPQKRVGDFATSKVRYTRDGVTSPHPQPALESIAQASVDAPEISYEPGQILKDAHKRGDISDEQLGAILLARQAHEKGKGFLNADDVGMGKTRQAAGVIADLLESGAANRVLYITKNKNLVDKHLTSEFAKVMTGQAGAKLPFESIDLTAIPNLSSAEIPVFSKAVYAISQNAVSKHTSAVINIGFDAVVVDEAHLFRSENPRASKVIAWTNLHQKLYNAKWTYFSATAGKSLDELSYLHGLGLWSQGGFENYIQKITGREAKKKQFFQSGSAFGSGTSLPLTEQVIREWKMQGLYLSRDFSREGVKFENKNFELETSEQAEFDRYRRFLNKVLKTALKYAPMNKLKGGTTKGIVKSMIQFAGKRFDLDMKVKKAISEMNSEIESGRRIVFFTSGLNGVKEDKDAALTNEEQELILSGGFLRAAINTINDRSIQMEKGEVIEDTDIPEAIADKTELLEEAQSFEQPLDLEQYVSENIKGKVLFYTGKTSDAKRRKNIKAWAEGKADALFLSDAGKTGIDANDVIGREITGYYGDVDFGVTTFKQALGRINRTNDKTSPTFKLLGLGSGAEQKFTATIASRMKNLGAVSKGQAESGVTDFLSQFDLEGAIANEAARRAWSNLSIDEKELFTNDKLYERDPNGDLRPKRVAEKSFWVDNYLYDLNLMPYEDGKRMFDHLLATYAEIIEQAEGIAQYKTDKATGKESREIVLYENPENNNDYLLLHEVTDNTDQSFGIVSGMLTPRISSLAKYGAKRFIKFDAEGKFISGLRVPRTNMSSLAKEFGLALASSITPENVYDVLQAGDKIPLVKGLELHKRRDGFIQVRGAKMSDRQVLQGAGAGFSSVGSYWRLKNEKEAIQKFLKGFPLADQGGDSKTDPIPSDSAGVKRFALENVERPDFGKDPSEIRHDAEEIQSPNQQASYMAEQFGIPLRRGRFRGKGLGIFKSKEEIIRLKGGDMQAASHEVGHFLWKNNKGLKVLAIQFGTELQQIATEGKNAIEEGFSEFVRFYVTDPDQAQGLAFHDAFEEYMEKNDLRGFGILKEARKDYRRWLDLPSSQKVLSQISFNPVKTTEHGFKYLYTQLIDDLNPLKEVVDKAKADGVQLTSENDVYMLAHLSRGWSSKAREFILNKTFIHEDGNTKVTGMGLREILKPVEKHMREFSAYLVSKRAVELDGRGIKTGIMKKDAQATIAELERKFPSFEKAQKDIVAYQDRVLDYVIERGLMAPDAKKRMRRMNREYVPFYRVFEEMGSKGFMGKGFANLKDPTKRIKGSDRDIVDPLESILKNTYAFIDAAERNSAAIALVKLAASSRDVSRMVEKIPAPMSKVATVSLKELGLDDLVDGEDLQKEMMDVFRPSMFVPQGNVIFISVNGKKEFYELDPDLYKAMSALNQETIGMVLKLISMPAKWLRAGAVLSPDFMLRNPARDQASAFLFSKFGYLPYVDMFRGFYSLVKKDEDYHRWLRAGGPGAELVALDRENLRFAVDQLGMNPAEAKIDRIQKEASLKGKVKNVINTPLEMLQALSMFTEQATRLGEFKLGSKPRREYLIAGKRGIPADDMTAAYASKEVSVNFGRMGASTRAASALISFFNASIQGTDRMIRAFKDNPSRTSFRLLISITLPSIILYLMNRDDEEYQEIPQWEKNLYWHFRIGDIMFRFPKPFEAGMIFGSMPERILQSIHDKEPHALDGLGKQIVDGLLPNFVPQVLMPWMENAANWRFFFERPVVPMRLSGLDPEQQFSEYTSETVKLMARGIAMLPGAEGTGLNSPLKLQNLISNYTGGLGRYGLGISDEMLFRMGIIGRPQKPKGEPADIPGLKAFISRPPVGSNSKSVNDFFLNYDKTETKDKTFKRLKKEDGVKSEAYLNKNKEQIEVAKFMRSQQRILSKHFKLRRQIFSDNRLTPEEKREQIDKVNKDIREIARNANKEYYRHLNGRAKK